jgi:hypothetical protein
MYLIFTYLSNLLADLFQGSQRLRKKSNFGDLFAMVKNSVPSIELTLLKKAFSVERRVLYIVVMLRTTTIYTPYFLLAALFSGQPILLFESVNLFLNHPTQRGFTRQAPVLGKYLLDTKTVRGRHRGENCRVPSVGKGYNYGIIMQHKVAFTQ